MSLPKRQSVCLISVTYLKPKSRQQSVRAKQPQSYLAVEEESGPDTETIQHICEIYAAVQDANRRLQARHAEVSGVQVPNWDTIYDANGCFHSDIEVLEGSSRKFDVRRMEVRPAGCTTAARNKDDDVAREESGKHNLVS